MRSWVEISRSAWQHNWKVITDAIQPAKPIAMIKANAYGHGAVEVSRMAEKIGVDWLGIATVPEGIELRDAGITLPILKNIIYRNMA